MKVDLKRLRVLKGLGLAAAADDIGVTRSVLYRAEVDQGIPHPKNAIAIAEFYDFDPLEQWPGLLERDAA